MIVPAPAIWIALGVWQRRLELRRVLAVAARVAAVCVSVSLWWVAMLLVQSRWGAPVLLYSETLEDVSRNSTGPEVFRGMGYWLFYGRDAFAATTTASIDYLTRSSGIVISFALAIVGLVGIGFGRIGHRQFPALLVGIGVVLAVGVHPIDDSSPLMKLLTSDSEAGLALALRSSTRAVPIVVLGLALGTAGLVERASTVPIRASLPAWASARRVSAAAVVVAAVVNMPSVWQAGLVDPALDRDSELPDVWNTAAAALDAQLPNTRVLQLPGAEFGAFNWGYTVDQPLVSATTRPLVTRDLLPLGAAPAMDLLYALDDRVQAGTLDPESLAPVARLFGVSTVWVANDVDALRFRTPRPGAIDDLIAHAPGIAKRTVFGEARPGPDHATDLFGRPLVDADAIVAVPAAVAPVVLANIADPQTIIRAKTNEILLSGSGDGIVDAAAAGLIDGTELLHLGGDIELVDPSMAVIVTDSSRDRARHWRSSQDVLGHTEPGGPGIDVLTPTAADQRLNPYENDHVEGAQTVAVQR
ncbi:MAG: alpha-(1-_3)-arabinofuranosyltransferase family protein, partial [Ilumatobacter sp.]|nr:alpha-(1->3)-arabinofuranosyltransferase family protein [Ilumatobacter sp.]